MIRFYLNVGPLGEFNGIAALEIDGQRYTPEEIAAIIRAQQGDDEAKALQLAREWQAVITTLAMDADEMLELNVEITPKEQRGHPFYWGKVATLRYLKELADADVKRFTNLDDEKPGSACQQN